MIPDATEWKNRKKYIIQKITINNTLCRYYVNTDTKQSQWERPTQPAYSNDDAPPGYNAGNRPPQSDSKNPYGDGYRGGPPGQDSDAALAARLQAEEDARARGGAGPPPGYGQGQYPPQQYGGPSGDSRDGGGGDRGFMGKIFGGGGRTQQMGSGGYGGGGYGNSQGSGYGPPGGGCGNYPPQGGYYPPQGGYPPPGGYGYGPPPGVYGGGYGGPGYGPGPGYAQQPPKKSGMSGMGMGLGGAALGLGAGLVGGALIEDVIDDHEQESYDQGYGKLLAVAKSSC